MCLEIIEKDTGVQVCAHHHVHRSCFQAWVDTDITALQRPCPQCRLPTGMVALTHLARAAAPERAARHLDILGQVDLTIHSSRSRAVETTVWVCAWDHPAHAHHAEKLAKDGTWKLHATLDTGLRIWDVGCPPLPIRSFPHLPHLEIMLANTDAILRLPANGHHLLLPVQCSPRHEGEDILRQFSCAMMRDPVPWRLWMDHERTLWWAVTLPHRVDLELAEDTLWWRMYDIMHRQRAPPDAWGAGVPPALRGRVDLPRASGLLYAIDSKAHWCQLMTMSLDRGPALRAGDLDGVAQHLAALYGSEDEIDTGKAAAGQG